MHKRSLAGLLALLLTACVPTAGSPPPASPSPPQATAAATSALPPSETPVAIGAPSPTAGVPPEAGATAGPAPSPVATTAVDQGDPIAALDAAHRPTRDQVELALALGSCRDTPDTCPRVARTTPLDVQVGEMRDFFITDFTTDRQYTIGAELRYAGPVALIYVERGLSFSQPALEAAARTFEQEIYPRNRELFGSELQPGVDGDNRITILNASNLNGGVLGYFSTQDSLPAQVNRFSNEREMFVMDGGALAFDNPAYLSVLAHEFQHMIHANEQPSSELWFNEGMSELATDLNGYFDNGFPPSYLANPDLQLTTFNQTAAEYGAAQLFIRYIYAQYAGEEQLRPLIRADAGQNLQAFVDLAAPRRPDITSFGQLVADWAVANLLDDVAVGDGRYGYATGHELPSLLPFAVTPMPAQDNLRDSVAQFGADYWELPAGTTRLAFAGSTEVGVASEPPIGRFAWWGGRSDDSIATLTRPLDLRGLSAASLEFDTWYEIENDYDYAFVSVSTDGGATWETLPGTQTTDDDPQGVNYGHGITGVSGAPGARINEGVRGRWVSERMDLSPYAGKEVLLRFWSINDQGLHAPGILIDNIRVPELSLSDDVEASADGWQAAGFVRVGPALPQRWELRLVRAAADGTVSVEPLPVDGAGQATATLAEGERGVLVVTGATPHTSERAAYEVSLE